MVVHRDMAYVVQSDVYRIVQEAVNNAVKHAQADRLLVELDSDDQAFSVTVRDNGRGMDQQPSASAGRSALPRWSPQVPDCRRCVNAAIC
ncbi:sensor histidine kinase [Streptomyces galilaeus]